MSYYSRRGVGRELLIAVLGSLLAALLLSTCSGSTTLRLDLHVGPAASSADTSGSL
jgi:hypothetical protein